MATKSEIKRKMWALVADHRDDQTGEVNMTFLAEDVAFELDCDEMLDDSDGPIWDAAFEVAQADERARRIAV
jgi:hypothetical protein